MSEAEQITDSDTDVTMADQPASHDLTLQGLLPEIQLQIFKHLDVCSSTCLGLTSRKFYSFHFQIHGTVSLVIPKTHTETIWVKPPYWESCTKQTITSTVLFKQGMVDDRGEKHFLHELIDEWMGPDYIWRASLALLRGQMCFFEKKTHVMSSEYVMGGQ